MVADTISSLISSGSLPSAVGGGALGFGMGWVCRKLLKLALIGIGLLLALLAYLQYQKWITVDWGIVQSQTSTFVHDSSQKVMDIMNSTAQQLHNPHIDAAYPVFGAAGFVPGFIFGMMKA